MHAIYLEMEKTAAWRDFMARVLRMRDDTTSELLCGTVDKFGNSRDSEKRAVLHCLNRLIIFTSAIHKQYDEFLKKKENIEKKAKRHDSIHGDDMLGVRFEESPRV